MGNTEQSAVDKLNKIKADIILNPWGNIEAGGLDDLCIESILIKSKTYCNGKEFPFTAKDIDNIISDLKS